MFLLVVIRFQSIESSIFTINNPLCINYIVYLKYEDVKVDFGELYDISYQRVFQLDETIEANTHLLCQQMSLKHICAHHAYTFIWHPHIYAYSCLSHASFNINISSNRLRIRIQSSSEYSSDYRSRFKASKTTYGLNHFVNCGRGCYWRQVALFNFLFSSKAYVKQTIRSRSPSRNVERTIRVKRCIENCWEAFEIVTRTFFGAHTHTHINTYRMYESLISALPWKIDI